MAFAPSFNWPNSNPQIIATQGLHISSQTMTQSYAIPSGNSAMTTGPFTIAGGSQLVIPSGSRLVVL